MDSHLNLAERTLNRLNQFSNTTNILFNLLKTRQDIFMLLTNLNQEYYRYDSLSRNNYMYSISQADLDLILQLYAKVAPYHCYTLTHCIDLAKKPLSFEDFRMFRRKIFKLCHHHLCLSQQNGSLDIQPFILDNTLEEFKNIM